MIFTKVSFFFFSRQLFLCVLPQDKSQWISRIKELRAWYSNVKEIVSCTLINIIVFLCMLSSPDQSNSDLCVCFLFFLCQHITNPRKVVGQQDLMINNPLSQDEGVKFIFIHISTSFAHKNMLMKLVINHHESNVISCQLIFCFLLCILYDLKPDGNYSILYSSCVIGSLWCITVEWHYGGEVSGDHKNSE